MTVQLMSHLYSSKCPVGSETADISLRNNTKINYQKCSRTWVSNLLEKRSGLCIQSITGITQNSQTGQKWHIVKPATLNSSKMQDCACTVWYTCHIYVLKMQIQTLLTHAFPLPTKRYIEIEVSTMWEDQHYHKC